MNAPRKLLIPQNLKNNNFDLMRLVLAIGVIFSHCYIIMLGSMEKELVRRFSHQQAELGTMAVYCFFIISGFLIVRSFEGSTSTGQYLRKRLLRILPGFIVAFFFSLLVVGPLGTADAAHPLGNWPDYMANISLKRFALDLVTLQAPHAPGGFETMPLPRLVNSSMWTIQQEFACYLAVPLLAAMGLFRNRRVVVIAFAVCATVMLLLWMPQAIMLQEAMLKAFRYPGYLPQMLVYFLAGGFCYLYRDRLVRNRWLALLALASIVVSARVAWFGITFPFAGTYLLFYLAFHPSVTFPRFARYGDFSYGTYLYGWPVQQLVNYFFGTYLNLNTFFLLSLSITLLFAVASWHLVEHPFLKLKRSAPKPARVPQPVPAAD